MNPTFECSFSIKLGNSSNPARTPNDSNPSKGDDDSNTSQNQGNSNANGGSNGPLAIQNPSRDDVSGTNNSFPSSSTNDNELELDQNSSDGTGTKRNIVQSDPVGDTRNSSEEVNPAELSLADATVNQEVTDTQTNATSPASKESDPTENGIPLKGAADLNPLLNCLNGNNKIGLGLLMKGFTPAGTPESTVPSGTPESTVPTSEIFFTENHKRKISDTDFESTVVKKVKTEHSTDPPLSGLPAKFDGNEPDNSGDDGDPKPRPPRITLSNENMYTRPSLESLNKTSGIVDNFTVGHQVHGEVVFVGPRDFSGMNLSEAVDFRHGGVNISLGLNFGPLHITLRNIKRDHFANLVKSNGEAITDEELKEIMDDLTVVMNALYNQYNEETETWTFLIIVP